MGTYEAATSLAPTAASEASLSTTTLSYAVWISTRGQTSQFTSASNSQFFSFSIRSFERMSVRIFRVLGWRDNYFSFSVSSSCKWARRASTSKSSTLKLRLSLHATGCSFWIPHSVQTGRPTNQISYRSKRFLHSQPPLLTPSISAKDYEKWVCSNTKVPLSQITPTLSLRSDLAMDLPPTIFTTLAISICASTSAELALAVQAFSAVHAFHAEAHTFPYLWWRRLSITL